MRRRPNGPLVVQVLTALAVCLLVGAVALVPAPSSPPATAAISPDAAKQIADAPAEQAGESGGAGVPGSTTTTTISAGTAEDPTAVPTTAAGPAGPPPGARVRRCVPNGDGTARQTEDPQSPPCVAFSPVTAATNGGATAKGVTGDTIRIAVPSFLDVPSVNDPSQLAAIAAHINERYELYGRRLEIVTFDAPYYTNGPSAAQLTSIAVKVDQELKAFAATAFTVGGSGETPFYEELARRKVVGVTSYAHHLRNADLLRASPYLWSTTPAFDQLAEAKADWYCSALAGGTADFAGKAQRGRPRVLGFVYANRVDGSDPGTPAILARLRSCSSDPVVTIAVPWNASFGTDYGFVTPTELSNSVVLQLRAKGVTTVYSEAGEVFEGAMWSSSSTSGYAPEWILTSLEYAGSSNIQFHPARDQIDHMLLLAGVNKGVRPDQEPAVAAVLAQDPRVPPDTVDPYLYRSFILLAAGIQAAGPDLTPATFAAGLERTRWNQGVLAKAPLFQAAVGFSSTDRAWMDGAAVAWFSSGRVAPENGKLGSICYLEGGRRYRIGAFPRTAEGLYSGCP